MTASTDSTESGRCGNLNQRGVMDDIRRVQYGSVGRALITEYLATFTTMLR